MSEIKSVLFLGIGGISLSSLALFLRAKGIDVYGSDRNYGEKISVLTENGCDVNVGNNVVFDRNPDLVVYSGAISDSDPELTYYRRAGYQCVERQIFLGEISRQFKYTVAIAGTHGKTTVTSMLTHVFLHANLNFYAHVGGDIKYPQDTPVDKNGKTGRILSGNCVYTGDDYLLTEACEYRRSLLALRPHIGVVLNAETDHPDTYKNLTEIYDAFDVFLDLSRSRGLAITCGDTPYYRARRAHSDDITFGFLPHNRFTAKDVYEHKNGYFGFTICDFSNPICKVELPIPGRHNVVNALAAAAVAATLKIDGDIIEAALESFPGVRRRFEKVSVFYGAKIFTDYAHHPSEISVSISTAKSMLGSGKRLFTVFQPHTYSRTEKLFKEFCACFEGSDEVLILKEYAARETSLMGKSASDLYEAIPLKKSYYENIIDIAAYLMQNISPDDIVLILGAGDIDNLSKLLKS